MKIVLWATDKSTGEDVYLRRSIPDGGDEEAAVARLMEAEPDYEYSGWDYEEA